MNIENVELARIVRDGGIESMDALNGVLVELEVHLSENEGRELRGAIAQSMCAILDNIVNPILKSHPELEVDEDLWGEIAVARMRNRLSSVD